MSDDCQWLKFFGFIIFIRFWSKKKKKKILKKFLKKKSLTKYQPFLSLNLSSLEKKTKQKKNDNFYLNT